MAREPVASKTLNAYQSSLDYLYRLEKFGMIFGLTQVKRILEALGNPHRELQVIHIGGTNGKGSTAALMASILQREGYRVGLYTSPHLIDFNERIRVNGQMIENEEVAELTSWMIERVHSAKIRDPFTFFDFTTAMAFLYFSRKTVDLAIVEVGLGGRLDSTNVVDPLLSMITNVSRDHEDVLGKTLLKIAGEKAGIIKKKRPVITAATQPGVLHLLSRVCREKGAPFYRVGKEFRSIGSDTTDFTYEGLHRKLWNLQVNPRGPHQIVNATTALGASEMLEQLGYPVSTSAMVEGLRSVEWPGRFEQVASSPRVILDGAHNPAGAIALRESLKEESSYRRLILLIGILKDKDFKTILRTLTPLADHIILSKPHFDRAAPVSLLEKAMKENGKTVEAIEDLEEAIQRGLSLTGTEDLLCITGSLYMVGEAKAYFHPPTQKTTGSARG
jgi:dihydrofolate synthase/folylpolyglutamate synthase